MALAIPIVAILVKPYTERAKQLERREARQMYERLALEKLDVIKTAVAMGFSHNEIGHLDARLEQLIGKEQMAGLLDKKVPVDPLPDSDLMDVDLQAELDRIRASKQKQ